MPYRDDREALRLRNAELEEQLGAGGAEVTTTCPIGQAVVERSDHPRLQPLDVRAPASANVRDPEGRRLFEPGSDRGPQHVFRAVVRKANGDDAPVKVGEACTIRLSSRPWDEVEPGRGERGELFCLYNMECGVRASGAFARCWFDERGLPTGGWTYFLCCMKAYLQHGIHLRAGLNKRITDVS